MRLHKYADKPAPMGLQTAGSFVGMDSAYLDRMDYFVKVLKDKGIFTKLSPTFGVKFGPEDIDRIPFHKEVGSFSENKTGHALPMVLFIFLKKYQTFRLNKPWLFKA